MSYDTELARLVAHVKQHALDHYDEGGWDVIVECWDDEHIANSIQNDNVIERAAGDPTKAEELAVLSFRDIVDVWADRQADAENSAF